MKDLIKGGIITLVIGGSAYSFSQGDVIKHFADDTGLSQEQAEQYVNEVSDDDLIPFDELGSDITKEGQEILDVVASIDCLEYDYEWQSVSLSCENGKIQMNKFGRDSISLGNAYTKLSSDSASKDDIARTITLIDQMNADLEFEIVRAHMDSVAIDEARKTNSYNKSLLMAALEGD